MHYWCVSWNSWAESSSSTCFTQDTVSQVLTRRAVNWRKEKEKLKNSDFVPQVHSRKLTSWGKMWRGMKGSCLDGHRNLSKMRYKQLFLCITRCLLCCQHLTWWTVINVKKCLCDTLCRHVCRRNRGLICNTAHDILLSKSYDDEFYNYLFCKKRITLTLWFIFGTYYINLLEIESILKTNKSTFKIQKNQQKSTWAVGVHKALDTRQLMSTLQNHRKNKCPGVHEVTAKIAPLHAWKQKHKCLAQFNSQNEIQLKTYMFSRTI